MPEGNASKISSEKKAILELLKNARVIKQQIRILKAVNLSSDNKTLLEKVMNSIKEEIDVFRI